MFLGSVAHFQGFFRTAVWPILLVGQLFGVMPVSGIQSELLSDLRFEWTSLRNLYTLVIIVALISYTLFVSWITLSTQIEFRSIG